MSLFPETLSPHDYKVGTTLRDVRQWQARILLGNSLSQDVKVGDMEGVGYVMVAIKGPPCFIPLAHSDAHNEGFDLLRKMAKHWRIKPTDFVAISPHHTGAYLHSMSEAPNLLEAFRRWHAARGPELMITYTGYNDSAKKRWSIGSKDFISGQGTPVPGKDGLLPMGQRFVDRLTRLRDCLVRLRDDDNPLVFNAHDREGMRQLAVATHATIDCAMNMREVVSILYGANAFGCKRGVTTEDAAAAWHARLDQLLADGDVTGIEAMFLSHDGLKNRVHQIVRHGSDFSKERLAEVFGDLELTDSVLGRIDPGVGLDEEPVASPSFRR